MNHLQLGAALNPKGDLLRQIEAVHAAGFDYADLAMDFPVTSENLDAALMKETLASLKLPFHGQTPAHLPFGSPYPEVRKAAVGIALKALEKLKHAGAQSVVFHPDGTHAFASDAYLEWNAECLQSVVDAAGSTQILVENLPHGPFAKTENLLALLQESGLEKKVQFNLDVGHVHCGQRDGGSTLDAFLETGKVKHVHVSDNDGQTDQHLPLGQGKIDWPAVKKQLLAARVPELTIECYAGGIQGVLDSKKAWEKS